MMVVAQSMITAGHQVQVYIRVVLLVIGKNIKESLAIAIGYIFIARAMHQDDWKVNNW